VADAAAKHGLGPKATPLYHRGRLYALGISGILSAFDAASGKRLWQTAPPAEPPFYGAASSPLGYEQLVIVHPGSYGPLTAFDAETGTVKWTSPGDGFYSSPVLAEFAGVRQIVTILQDRVIGVTPAGTRLWEHPYKAQGGATTPLVHDGLVVVSGQQMGVAAIRPVTRNGQWSAEAAWEIKEVSMFMSNPVAIGATLYGLSHRNSGQLFAVDVASGKVLWLGEQREAENTAVVKAGSLLFLLHDDGELVVATPAPAGISPVKRYTVSDAATWAQPAISGDRVFVKDARTLALWTWTP
jgi:outer membrane protein assembly factor BamB